MRKRKWSQDLKVNSAWSALNFVPRISFWLCQSITTSDLDRTKSNHY